MIPIRGRKRLVFASIYTEALWDLVKLNDPH